MNTVNNKRRKDSQEKIEKIFIDLIQTKEINEILVTEICKKAKINRSTFYANYIDIYDLADKVVKRIEEEVLSLYKEERESNKNSHNYLKLFIHIKNNQLLYKTYFKLNRDKNYIFKEYDINLAKIKFDNQYIDYHMEFFMAGLNAIIKKWLNNSCLETPAEMYKILKDEYKNI